MMLGMLKWVTRQRGAHDVAPTVASTTKSPWTWRGNARGLTQIRVPAGVSLAARLIAPGKTAWVPAGVESAR